MKSDGGSVAPVPQNEDAERAILGSILLDANMLDRITEIVRPSDFWNSRCGAVYEAMVALHERQEPVDYLTLLDEIQRSGKLTQTGGTGFIGGLLLEVPTPINAPTYARIVADMATMRRLAQAGGKISTLGFQASLSPSEAMDQSRRLLDEIGAERPGAGPQAFEDVLGGYLTHVAADQSGASPLRVPTGFIDLDKLLGGGIERTSLLVLAARPSMGKTAMSLNVLARVLKRDMGGLLFSLEMSAEEIAERLLSTESGVSAQRIRAGDPTDAEVRRIGLAINGLAERRFWVDDGSGLTVHQIRDRARRLHARNPLDLIVVDHLQLIQGTSSKRDDNRAQELSEISRQLKGMARELSVPVIALSQLSRAVEGRSSKVPELRDLRDSGAIEQDADVVAFLYRDEYYDPDSEQRGIADLIVAKHRNGPTGRLKMIFNERTATFLDAEIGY